MYSMYRDGGILYCVCREAFKGPSMSGCSAYTRALRFPWEPHAARQAAWSRRYIERSFEVRTTRVVYRMGQILGSGKISAVALRLCVAQLTSRLRKHFPR